MLVPVDSRPPYSHIVIKLHRPPSERSGRLRCVPLYATFRTAGCQTPAGAVWLRQPGGILGEGSSAPVWSLAPGTHPAGYIWQNGTARRWDDVVGPTSGPDFLEAGAVAVCQLHGHVFVGGAVLNTVDSKAKLTLCYWRNGRKCDLPGAEKGYRVYDIIAVERAARTSVGPGGLGRAGRAVGRMKGAGGVKDARFDVRGRRVPARHGIEPSTVTVSPKGRKRIPVR